MDFLGLFVVLIVFALMEFVAWFTHKYIMHGFLWYLHKDHHHNKNKSFFELNDFFFLIFAIPGSLLLVFGSNVGLGDTPFWSGLGITLYGGAYFFVHDLFIHQRIKVLKKTRNKYLLAIRRGHKVHHKKTIKEGGECFGMLIVPFKYFKLYK